jgi:iron complex outermembrane receptor protein
MHLNLSQRSPRSPRACDQPIDGNVHHRRFCMHRDKDRLWRSCIAATPSLVVACLAAASAARAAETDVLVEEVIVTGSYIRGTVQNTALPVSVIDRAELEKQGSPAIIDVIRSLSASQGTVGESNAQQIFLGGSSTSINLRGLDGGRTLVLFNGRRLPVSPVPLIGVDVNLLPLASVERIEVLKDGAAALYGSDAVAGVVNFISRRGLEGLSLDGSYTSIDDSDGDYSTNLAWGHKWNAVDVLVAAGYRHRSELRSIDRDFAVPPFDRTLAGQGGFSGSGSPGAFIIPPVGAVPNVVVDPACESLGGGVRVSGGLPQCQFQFTRFQNLVERQENYDLYAELNTHIGPFADLHVEGYYVVHDSPEENFSPSFPVTQGPGQITQRRLGLPVDPLNAPTFIVPLTNPGLRALLPALTPAQRTAITQAGAVAASGLLFRPLGVTGNPLFENEGAQQERFFDSHRFSASLDGAIGAIEWNLGVTYAEDHRRSRIPDVLTANLQLALAGFGGANCTGSVPGANWCLFFNPFSTGIAQHALTGQTNPSLALGGTFDPTTVNSREVVDFIFGTRGVDDISDVAVVDLRFSGEAPFELPGGAVGWALGAQYREDGLKRELHDPIANLARTPCPDSILDPAATCVLTTGAFAFDGGQREFDIDSDVVGVFGELSVPIVKSLTAQLAYRYEDYGGTTGSTSNPKLAMRWQATDWLALRGSVGSTFRGPPLVQQQPTAITALVFAPQFGVVRPFDNFGSANLKPEEADNFNLGVLVSTESFSASLDYFDIDLTNKIVQENSADVLGAFFGPGPAIINNCGRPGYERLQARFTFQNGVCSPQNLLRTRVIAVNGADEHAKGLDLAATYTFRNVLRGNVTVGVDATYNLEYTRAPFYIEGILVPTAGGRDFVGTRGGIQSLPELRGSMFAEYGASAHNVRVTGHYVDGVTDLQPAARDPNGQLDHIGSYFTTDIVWRWSLPADLTLTGAVFNAADREPSVVKFADFSYDPLFANPVGRAFKLALAKRFR